MTRIEQLQHEVRRMHDLQREYLAAGPDYWLGIQDAIHEEVILLTEIAKLQEEA